MKEIAKNFTIIDTKVFYDDNEYSYTIKSNDIIITFFQLNHRLKTVTQELTPEMQRIFNGSMYIKHYDDYIKVFNITPPTSKTVWELKEDDEYYAIDNLDLEPCRIIYDGDDYDNNLRVLGEMYLTEEECQRAIDEKIALTKVNKRIDELNEGWVPTKKLEDTYFISYSRDLKLLIPVLFYNYVFSIKIKACKTDKIANQIIDEFQDELKTIFNIKEEKLNEKIDTDSSVSNDSNRLQ